MVVKDKTHRIVVQHAGESGPTYTVPYTGTKKECEDYARRRWGGFPVFLAITTRDKDFHLCFRAGGKRTDILSKET